MLVFGCYRSLTRRVGFSVKDPLACASGLYFRSLTRRVSCSALPVGEPPTPPRRDVPPPKGRVTSFGFQRYFRGAKGD